MTPGRDALEILHRLRARACPGRAALGLVAREQRRPAPPLVHGGELPAEIDRIADAGVHAEPAIRWHDVHGVAGEEYALAAVALGHEVAASPYAYGEDLEVEIPSHGAAHCLGGLL